MMYTGKSEDGSDAQPVEGVYVNPKNPNEWSSEPWPEQMRMLRLKEAFMEYASGRYSLDDVYHQIQEKTCPLPKRVRDYVLSHYDEEGNFITDENQE